MTLSFYKDREHLIGEYVNANYDKSTGLEPEVIEQEIRSYIENNPDMPLPLVVANTFAYFIDNVQLELNPYNIFPEKYNSGATYEPFQSLSLFGKIASERCRRNMDREAGDVWKRRMTCALAGLSNPATDFWHSSPDWSSVLRYGIGGLLDRAVEYKKKAADEGRLDTETEIFYDSVIICYEAAVRYMLRVSAYAREKGMDEYADTMARLTKQPPATFYEAMLTSFIFLNLGESGVEHYRTYGMVDKLYYPYYVADIESGRITREDAAEMIRYFLQKTEAAQREAAQPLCLGGIDENGNDRTNELTYLFLKVYRELEIFNPKIHIRINKNTPQDIYEIAASYIRDGLSSIVLISDEQVMRAYERLGVPREVSYDYTPTGCYEPVIMDREDARICASWLNLSAPVAYTVRAEYTDLHAKIGLPKAVEEPSTFEEFMYEYFRMLGALIEFTKNNIVEQKRVEYKVNPSPFLSGCYEPCMRRGKDMCNFGMDMINLSIKCFAIGTAVDSILAVKKVVYDEKLMSMREFAQVLRDNWIGHEQLRAHIRADRNKWGNNYAEPNEIAKRIYEFCASRIVGAPNGFGGVFRLGADSVAMSELIGHNTPATPDGRAFRDPTTKNYRPQNGMEFEGVTAFVNSVTCFDGSMFVDGSPLDFLVHPSAVEGDDGLCALIAVIKTYFARGGSAIQGNIMSAETLRDAQAHPENYRNLQVRVCGWNEYFVHMKKFLQDDFIARAEGIENS